MFRRSCSRSVVPHGAVHIRLANRAIRASLKPLVDAGSVENMVARQTPDLFAIRKAGKANHALCLNARLIMVVTFAPPELVHAVDGLGRQPTPAAQHLLHFNEAVLVIPGDSVCVEQQHLKPLGQLCELLEVFRWKKVSQLRMENAFAIDRGVAADACRPRRLAAHHLELHALVRELVVDSESHMLVPIFCEIRLQVVIEDVEIIRVRQRVLERDYVDLLELRRWVDIHVHHGVRVDNADV
mmetsp:Transcript_59282/g.166914  ORF Transcript_59282/g.166914 Transcript_59282/m.166914 type:complete len:241 (-) Transcript_59282:835-1557(-)